MNSETPVHLLSAALLALLPSTFGACSGSGLSSQEKAGCGVMCLKASVCIGSSPQTPPTECVQECKEFLSSASQVCQDVVAKLGRCGGHLDCTALDLGACRVELAAVEKACQEGQDGGVGSCEQFEFVASGDQCPPYGCPLLTCECPDTWARYINSCTSDGCIVEANCEQVCAADSLEDALDCVEEHSIAENTDGGDT